MRTLAAIVVSLAVAAVPALSRDLTVRFTASFGGSIEGCDCKVSPAAGLVKVAAWLRASHDPSRDVLLDAGDILDGTSDPLLATALLDSCAELGYGAIAVGERELGLGPEALLGVGARYPLLCHNLWARSEAGRWVPFSTDPLLLLRGESEVVVLSLLGPESLEGTAAQSSRDFRVDPPSSSAARLLRDPRVASADLVVLLYHGSLDAASALLRSIRGVDLAIVAHEQKLVPAYRQGGVVVSSPGEAGNRVGIVSIARRPLLPPAFSWSMHSFDARFGPDDPSVRRRAEEYTAALRARLTGRRD